MQTKLITLTAIAVLAALASLPAPAHAGVKRTLGDKVDAYNKCEKNGGDTAVCCIAAGGDLTPGGGHPEGHPEVTLGDACMLTADLSPGATTSGGKKILITRPGVVSLSMAH
jgi:hypothetical protein